MGKPPKSGDWLTACGSGARQIQHTPHTCRGPIGSLTEGPSGKIRMAYSHTIQNTPHTLRGPRWGPHRRH
eukprot:5335394-Pyramimonas_sp.AAC.1